MEQDFGWGAVVHLEKIKSTVTTEEQMTVKVLLHVTKESAGSKVASELKAVTDPKEKGEMTIVSIMFPLIQQISRNDQDLKKSNYYALYTYFKLLKEITF